MRVERQTWIGVRPWAIGIVLVYALMVIALAIPATFAAGNKSPEVLDLYGAWQAWCVGGLLVLGECALLLVPVRQAERRPKPRRSLLIPIIATLLFLWILLLEAGHCVYLAVWGERGSDAVALRFTVCLGATSLVLWTVWGWLFLRYRRTTAPSALTPRLMRWLLAGSALELLIAVPSHVIVRQRNECCAPGLSALGLYMGVAVMLMSFGPGVLLLYVERMDRLTGRSVLCPNCGYNRRETPQRCPECGTELVQRVR